MVTAILTKLPRLAQVSEDHCGPAVIQMMLANLGIESDQKKLTKDAGITRAIHKRGSRIDELDFMVRKTSKDVRLWYKDHATLKDIAYIIDTYQLPVAIEWQGLFGYRINPTTGHKKAINDGHYSIVTQIDFDKQEVTLIDPYMAFVNQDRIFTFRQFKKRWWDTNDIAKDNGEVVTTYDYKLLFFIAPKTIVFPDSIGLLPASKYLSNLPL